MDSKDLFHSNENSQELHETDPASQSVENSTPVSCAVSNIDGVPSDNSQEICDKSISKCSGSPPSGDDYMYAVCKLVEEAEALNSVNDPPKENNSDKELSITAFDSNSHNDKNADQSLNCSEGENPVISTDKQITALDSNDHIDKNTEQSLNCSDGENPITSKGEDVTDGMDVVNDEDNMYLPEGYRITKISGASDEFKCEIKMKDVFLKGCKWAPDGSCLLTSCEDKWLRIFDLPTELYTEKEWSNMKTLPDLKSTVKVKAGGRIYDFCWYCRMNSWLPESCCFFTTSAGEPTHLWDAYNGELRASYRAVNYADELVSALSITCSPDGEKLYCGFKSKLNVYDILLSGQKPTIYDIKVLTGQTGLVSTIAVNPNLQSLFAVGTYEKTVGLYSSNDNSGICVFSGHNGGLTHMMFSPDGTRLYTGSRSDQEIVCWDLRTPGKVLFSLTRNVTTQQRVYFDLTPDGNSLITGNTDGCVSLWNLGGNRALNDQEPVLPDFTFTAHNDCTNGISINQKYPVLATSSGQRHVPDLISDIEEDDDGCNEDDVDKSSYFFDCDSMEKRKENCVKLWWIGRVKD